MRRIILLAILTAAALTSTARAQDPCDVNPDDPSCDVELFTATPATPDVCPAGGWVFVFMGTPYPVCNGLPGAPGAAGCLSRREFDVSIPQRFRWGTRVTVLVGGRKQWDGNSPSVFVRANHRIRVALQGRPCGVYAVIVTKRGKRPWFRLYTAGPNGNMTGINLAMARR
jgi:hypothetical protein